ncbi:MAG: amidase [Calditrichaeota bacterium]|nr:amidase [Calditrichota bacterium]
MWVLMMVIVFAAGSCQKSEAPAAKAQINLIEITGDELQDGYKNGDFTIEDVVRAYLERIERIDRNGPKLNSVICLNPEALQIAIALDQELAAGKSRGPMHGIPVLLKDNIDTHDRMPTTAGARALANSFPLEDSYITGKLREAGAVILGKTNLSEWANFHSSFSSSGWSGVGGQTNNPYDPTCNPCGSSSGSGVAVSANLCVIAIGTETNGSIVCPSNNNGIVGIKPTVGLLSRTGIIPISFTQDTPGPMARTVRDAAICLGVMTGIDPSDSKTAASEGKSFTDYTQFLKADGLQGKRIGFYTGPMGSHFRLDAVMEQAVAFFEGEGAEVIEVDKLIGEAAEDLSYQVLLYEFRDGLNQYFDALGDQAPVKDLEELIALTFADSVEMRYFDHVLLKEAEEKHDMHDPEYLNALEKMHRQTRENGIDRVMDEYQLDAIISPTGGPAWKTDLVNGDNFGVYSSSPAAIAGYPSISVPMGFIEGLPVGISIFGRAWSEPLLLEIAYAYEQGTMHRRAPVGE